MEPEPLAKLPGTDMSTCNEVLLLLYHAFVICHARDPHSGPAICAEPSIYCLQLLICGQDVHVCLYMLPML